MILYPAIDVLGGKAVRLTRGDFEAKKVYDEDPLQAAEAWVADGAGHLHVVDLDGAKQGQPRNLAHLRRIADRLSVPVQFGGGLRSIDSIEQALAAGASRVILGTAAFEDPLLLSQALARWPNRVLVSVDARGGRVATAGWTQTTELRTAEVIADLVAQGVPEFVCTDVERDGMLQGPDLQGMQSLASAVPKARLICSGGIGSLSDLQALSALPGDAVSGVIVGKALYERRFTVAQALATLNAGQEV